MKRIFTTAMVVAAWLCLSITAFADSEPTYATFFVDITNSSYEPTVNTAPSGDGVEVKFTQQDVDDLAENYSFHQFHKAFPNSTDPNLEQRYIVEVSSLQFMHDLTVFNSTVFSNAEIADFKEHYVTITDPAYVPTYQLNNYVSTVTFAQSALNDIAADYSFTGFYPAFPNSTEPSQTDIYIVQVNDEGFMTGLNTYNSTIFTGITPVSRKRFLISITDHSYVPYLSVNIYNQLVATSGDPTVQAIVNQYTIFDIHQAFPGSALQHLRQQYFIECNSFDLLTDLTSYNNTVFPRGSESHRAVPTYTPIDYGHAFSLPIDHHQKYLDLIGAQEAWNITQGNPNIKMAINDWYTNLSHPDLANKVRTTGIYRNDPSHIYKNSQGQLNYFHGTAVTGTMVGATDNKVNGDTIGQASIGFNCKVGLYSTDGKGEPAEDVLLLSQDGNKVINCSWVYDMFCNDDTTDITKNWFYASHELEDVYNECYENGSLMVGGAGNSDQLMCTRSSYMFPASFPHWMSVTSIGSNIRSDTANNFDSSVIDEHDFYRAPSIMPIPNRPGHTHNKLVDISAPGYTVHVLNYNPNYPNINYLPDMYGTSFAAPIVGGTAGLILSIPKKDCFSPYQLEYILKKTAEDSIYNIPANQPYANPNLLGSGRLNSGSAIQFARDSIECNDSATRTMYIEEIKLNHTCINSFLGGNPIQLSAVIRNGNGNYTYRWRWIGDNTVKIDDEHIASPKVVKANSWTNTNGEYVLYYMLTVTEAGTDIPKVATSRIRVVLREEGVDYAMKDAFGDMYNEPNYMDTVDNRNWNFWVSPDLWCRWNLDTPKVTQHQDPEYSPTNPNYIHVRVKNIGCTQPISAGDEKLRVYWTKASTGEIWPGSWTTDNLQGTNGTVPAGREITTSPINLPILYPGEDTIITIPWYPPDPADYDTGSIQMEVCLLARIIDSSLNEVNGNVFTNVRNNNNIVTRNLFVNDYSANKPSSKHSIDIVNGEGMAEAFTLELLNDKEIHRHYSGDLSEYMYGVLHLNSLYDVWTDGGGLGSGYVLDDQNHTLAFDLATPLVLENLELTAGERHTVYVEFILKDNIEVPYTVRNQLVHLRQSYYNDEEEYQLAGNVSFSINIDKIEPQNKPSMSTGVGNLSTQQLVIAYPNPASSYVLFDYKLPQQAKDMKLIVTNITGQVVSEIAIGSDNKNGTVRWETANNPSGVYIYKLTDGSTTYDIGKVVLAK